MGDHGVVERDVPSSRGIRAAVAVANDFVDERLARGVVAAFEARRRGHKTPAVDVAKREGLLNVAGLKTFTVLDGVENEHARGIELCARSEVVGFEVDAGAVSVTQNDRASPNFVFRAISMLFDFDEEHHTVEFGASRERGKGPHAAIVEGVIFRFDGAKDVRFTRVVVDSLKIAIGAKDSVLSREIKRFAYHGTVRFTIRSDGIITFSCIKIEFDDPMAMFEEGVRGGVRTDSRAGRVR